MLPNCPNCERPPETRNWNTYCPDCGLEAPTGNTPEKCEQEWVKMLELRTRRDAERYRYLRALSYRSHTGYGTGRRYTVELQFEAPQRPESLAEHAFEDFDAAVDRAMAAAAVARKQSSRKPKEAGAGRGKSSERHVASCIAPRTVGLITFAEYQRMTYQNWQKLGKLKKQQRHDFQKAQPKNCPQCGEQVFDRGGWGVVIHDVTHKIK